MTHYTASVTYRVRNAAGELESKTVEQDVTDEVNAGSDKEELADRLYWKHVHGAAGFFDIVGGGVDAA